MADQPSEQQYRRPPITEDVIALNFEEPWVEKRLARISSALAPFYPGEQRVRNFGLSVGMPGALDQKLIAEVNEEIAHRRLSDDETEIVLINPATLVVSQLAPYVGWTTFFRRFKRDWAAIRHATGYRKLVRVGVRYINRIDIPYENNVAQESAFLNLIPLLPAFLQPVQSYGIQVQTQLPDLNAQLVLNSAVVPSPLLRHGALLLDIDVSVYRNVPQKEEDVYELLERIRLKKNEIFEACITDLARERMNDDHGAAR